MKTYLVRSLIVFSVLALTPLGAALAHGEPVIAIEPAVVAAGGQISVTIADKCLVYPFQRNSRYPFIAEKRIQWAIGE